MTSHRNSLILNLNDHTSNYPKFFKKVYDKNIQTKKNSILIGLIKYQKRTKIIFFGGH